MARYSLDCFNCGDILEYESIPGRSEECESCDADVRCCLNCKYYDRSAPNQCREPTAEFVSKKDQSNFCGQFTFRDRQGPSKSSDVEDARAKLEALFK